MSAVIQLIQHMKQVLTLCDAMKTAEKARVAALKADASRLFRQGFDQYTAIESLVNSATASTAAREHSELHVLVAEAAFQTEYIDIARKTVERYLQLSPQKDQFYCKAKVLMGLIINAEAKHKNGNALLKSNQQAIAEVMVALDVVSDPKNSARYKFALFNVSVAFWKIVHQFLRSNRAKFFVAEFGRVVSALEEQNDPDKEWRIMFLSAAALCCEDANDAKTASEYVDKAIAHADTLLQKTLKEEEAAAAELATASAEVDQIMSAFRAIEDREELLHKPPKIDPDAPPIDPNNPPTPPELPPLEGLAAEGYDKVKEMLDTSQHTKNSLDSRMREILEVKSQQIETMIRLHMQRISVNPSDAKRYLGQPQLSSAGAPSPRVAVLVQLQAIVSGCVQEKELDNAYTTIMKILTELPPSVMRNETLLDVSRTAWRLQRVDIASECAKLAQEGTIVSKVLRVKQDICDAVKILADIETENANESTGRRLTSKQAEGYFLSKRIDALKLLERCTTVCLGIGKDSFLVQEVCLLMWNGIIPLLQEHLRAKVHSCLKAMATALQAVASPLVQLRMQVLYELAKCEEQADYVAIAKDAGVQAVQCDYGGLEHETPFEARERERLHGAGSVVDDSTSVVAGAHDGFDRNRNMDHIIKPFVNLLELRSSVFDVPADAEGQVQLWLQQAKESKSKPFIVEMVTKSLFVLLDEIKATGGRAGGSKGSKSSDGLSMAPNSVTDWSVMLLRMGKITISELPLSDLQKLLAIDRSITAGSESQPFSTFSNLIQTRMIIFSDIARMGHATNSVNLVQHAVEYLVQYVWDHNDLFLRPLINMQVQAYFYLADNMLHRINSHGLIKRSRDNAHDFTAIRSESAAAGDVLDGEVDVATALIAEREKAAAVALKSFQSMDPRSLGLVAEEGTVADDVSQMKLMVIQFLRNGLELAMSVKDYTAVQNGIVYFWNLHLHVFRNALYAYAIDDLFEFLRIISSMIDKLLEESPKAKKYIGFDHRLRFAILETIVEWLQFKEDLQQAIDVAMKGINATYEGITEYNRKALCELASRLTLVLAAKGGGGGKGGKGAAPGDPPVFDQPFLNVFAAIAQAEQPQYLLPQEKAITLTNSAQQLMEDAVAKELESMPLSTFTAERNGQLQELKVEAWTRLTRLRMIFGDTIGAQYCAEKCLTLVPQPSGVLSVDGSSIVQTEGEVGPRIWRWISVCERLFGCAIANIIQSDGQAESLQNELRLVAMQHFCNACDRGLLANKETLVVEAATTAWNICIPLVNVSDLRSRLYKLLRKILDALLQCRGADTFDAVDELRQQFYLAVIEGYARIEQWDKTMSSIMEAFEYVSSKRQKPLWQWRVVAMSKKGKSVLDGIQKLKESDPSLQAQVFGILARASSIKQQQLESYLQAIDILKFSMERVDYMLELAQWMGSSGIPRTDITELLKAAMDAFYEVEEQSMPEIAELDEDEVAEYLQCGLMPSATAGSLQLVDDTDSIQSSTKLASQSGRSRGAPSQVSRRSERPAGSAAGTEVSRRASTNAAPSTSAQKLPSAAGSRRGSRDSLTKQSRRSAGSGGKGSGTKRGGSVAGNDESVFLPEKLNFKMLEQASRSLIMLSMLESSHSLSLERSLEALFFVEKALNLWFSSLILCFRKKMYAALSVEEREGTEESPVIDFENYHPDLPEYLNVPNDGIDFLLWVDTSSDNEQREELIGAAIEHSPTDCPSEKTLPSFPLTLHYLTVLADDLYRGGLSKDALRIYAWMKLLLVSLKPSYDGAKAMLSMLYFRIVRILLDCGLDDIAQKLSTKLVLSTDSSHSSIGDYLVQIVAEYSSAAAAEQSEKSSEERSSTSPSSRAMKRSAVEANGESIFGIVTWTEAFNANGGGERLKCILDIAQSLLDLGHTTLCKSLVLTVKKEYTKQSNSRGLVECATIFAKLQLLNGCYEDAIATILSHREDLESAGDPLQLAEHSELLAKCHIKLDNADEAVSITSLSLSLLEDSAIFMIDKYALQKQLKQQQELESQGFNAASAKTLASTMNTDGGRKSSAASRASLESKSKKKLLVEMSRPHANALYITVQAYGRSLLSSLRRQLSVGTSSDGSSEGPMQKFAAFCSEFDKCCELIIDIVGLQTPLMAQMLTLRGELGIEFVHMIACFASNAVALDKYHSWLTENIKTCITYLERSYDSYRLLFADIPVAELHLESSEIVSNAESTLHDGVMKRPYRNVSVPMHRAVALSQMRLAVAQSAFAVFTLQYSSSTDFSDPPDLNCIEQYLEDTKLPVKLQIDNFQVPILHRATAILSEACTTLEDSPYLNKTCHLMSAAIAVIRRCGAGEFDCMWRPRRPKVKPLPIHHDESSGGDGEDHGDTAASQEEKSTASETVNEAPMILGEAGLNEFTKIDQQTLVTRTREYLKDKYSSIALISDSCDLKIDQYRTVIYSCLALCESFGLHSSMKAAMWLLQLQSTVTSKWLASMWREMALNPVSEVAQSLNRSERLILTDIPREDSLKQFDAELELLEESSTPFRRLSIAADPETILAMALPKTAILCLQFCPWRKVLYLCAGTPHPPVAIDAPAATTKKGKAKGAPADHHAVDDSKRLNEFWIIEKFEFSEETRRELQIIIKQHRQWLADMTKFIAVNGENAPTNFDLLGDDSKYLGRTLKKSERALEERLRALINDMERCFAPLLGPDSKAHSFLMSLLHPQSRYAKMRRKDHEERIRAGDPTAIHSTEELATDESTGSLLDELGPEQHWSLLLLVDSTLQELPWEALNLIGLFDGQVSRDFSLHMYHHRLVTLRGGVRPNGSEDGTAAEVTAKIISAAAAHSGLPTAVSRSGVKYLVDPFSEDSGSRMKGYQRSSISKAMEDLVTTLPPAANASQWRKVREEKGVVTTTDFLRAIDESTQRYAAKQGTALTSGSTKGKAAPSTAVDVNPNQMLLTYTLGRFGSVLPPIEIAAVNMESIAALICLDMANNDTSSRRQISSDVLKKTRRIEIEQPLLMAAIFSLAGAGSVCSFSWSTPINSQNRFLKTLMHHFTNNSSVVIPAHVKAPVVDGKMPLVQALALTNYPPGSDVALAPESVVIAPSTDSVDASMSRVNSMFGSATGEVPADDAAAAPKAIKMWVRFARVLYGAGHVTYE